MALAAEQSLSAQAALSVPPTTYDFALRGSDTLRMDVFVNKDIPVKGPRPVFLYMFGGGWEGGKRISSTIAASGLLDRFIERGYVGVSIDYRLGFKMAHEEGLIDHDCTIFKCLEKPDVYFNKEDVWGAVIRAARWGVEDLYSATAYLVEHAKDLDIDPKRIMISGGSAGAINATMGEYLLCNDDPLTELLPEGFDYAAVFAYGGGVWDGNRGETTWKREPCPMAFFHGNADPTVPFSTVVYDYGAAHGVKELAAQLRANGWSYALYEYEGEDHSMSFLPMALNVDDMFAFIRSAVTRGEKTQLDYFQRLNGKPYDGIRMLEAMEQAKGLDPKDR